MAIKKEVLCCPPSCLACQIADFTKPVFSCFVFPPVEIECSRESFLKEKDDVLLLPRQSSLNKNKTGTSKPVHDFSSCVTENY